MIRLDEPFKDKKIIARKSIGKLVLKSYQILVELLRFKKSLHVYKLSQKLCTSLLLFRIKEIINASKKISTPIVTAHLEDPLDPEFARLVDLSQEVERQTLFRVLFAKFRVYLLNLEFIC